MSILLINANALTIPLASGSVQIVATSPPYYGLRDYGICDQLGLEPTPEAYVANLVAVFREVRRVLREDGVVFLNLGDSYNGSGGAGGDYSEGGLKEGQPKYPGRNVSTLKPKDLIGIPWRVAFALQADGWWLRSDIIWAKPNPMPESVTDRPTKAHEYVFLLTKSSRYYWDQEAVREKQDPKSLERLKRGWNGDNMRGYPYGPQNHLKKYMSKTDDEIANLPGRNIRSVWTIPTKSYSGAHFATWPPKLVEPMIKAGSSEKGCCPACGKPWVRVVEHKNMVIARSDRTHELGRTRSSGTMLEPAISQTIGWQPACDCNAGEPVPCIVLDPFCGSGTTLLVARQLGRSAIGLDLSYAYLHDQARKRLDLDRLAMWQKAAAP